jgi:hypothetical protein
LEAAVVNEPFDSWKKKPNYSFRAQWLSKAKLRLAFAERVTIAALARREAPPPLAELELEHHELKHWPEGWQLYFVIEAFMMFDSLEALTAHIKAFFKRHDFSAGLWEALLSDEAAPVRLSKSQRVRLIDKTLKTIAAHPFDAPEQEFLEIVEPFGEYALALSVEYANFRRFMDGDFKAEDNPIKSLIGLECRVTELAFDAEDDNATLLAEGVLELSGNTVRVGDWQQSFEEEDEVFESVPYFEVNIASESLQRTVCFKRLNVSEDET